MRSVNEKFPMQNEGTEYLCKVVRETNRFIEKNAKRMKHNDYIGCMVEEMKPHVLSNLCVWQEGEATIPSIKECKHSGKMR